MLQLLCFAALEHSDLPAVLPGTVHCVSSVLVESFLHSCFNKLPYVSICSTTGESDLTFQSAGPCALWTHRPRVSTSATFITLNDWLTEWRPSVIAPETPPAAFTTFIHFCPPVPHFMTDKPNQSLLSPPFVAFLLSSLRLEGTCPLQFQKQQTRLSCQGVNTLLRWVS